MSLFVPGFFKMNRLLPDPFLYFLFPREIMEPGTVTSYWKHLKSLKMYRTNQKVNLTTYVLFLPLKKTAFVLDFLTKFDRQEEERKKRLTNCSIFSSDILSLQ